LRLASRIDTIVLRQDHRENDYAMNYCRFSFACALLLAIAGASEVFAQTAAPTPAPVKAPAHRAKAKANVAPPAAGIEALKFSDPSAPLGDDAKPRKPTPPKADKPVAKIPEGGTSLDVKWHADNSHINDRYWEPWVPNGQGANVEAGMKLGF
jgi:hypothetical protein